MIFVTFFLMILYNNYRNKENNANTEKEKGDKMTKIHYYKGYAIDKPEGCEMWNIHEIKDDVIDWCFCVSFAENIKSAKITIDAIIEENL